MRTTHKTTQHFWHVFGVFSRPRPSVSLGARVVLPLLILMMASFSLSGCIFKKSPEKINALIDSGNTTDALNAIERQLADAPNSPVFNILALKARLARCAELNCPANQPESMERIGVSLSKLSGPVNVAEKLTLDPQQLLATYAPQYASLPEFPSGLLSLLKRVPENNATGRQVVIDALYTPALVALQKADMSQANQALQTLNRSGSLASLYTQWAGAMGSLLQADSLRAQSNLTGLRSESSSTNLPATGVRLLPYVLLLAPQMAPQDPPQQVSTTATPATQPAIPAAPLPQGTLGKITAISPTIASWKLPAHLLDTNAQKVVADEVNKLRQNDALLTRLLANWVPAQGNAARTSNAGTVVTNLTPSVPLTDSGVALQLHLAALSLKLDASQSSLWNQFLPLASRYTEATGDASLFAGLSLTSLPSSQQQQVVANLFTLIQTQAKAGQPILPILTQIGQLSLDKATETKLEKLIQTGLENAVSNRHLEEVLAYARFKPDLARLNRNSITPLVVARVREDLANNNFDAAVALSNLLNNTLEIDFDLAGQLKQEFDNQVDRTKLIDALSATDSSFLMQSTETATVDLGPLWGFMLEYFANNPIEINDILRNLVGRAHGVWGTPTAMHRLFTAFNDTEFPPANRRAYLVKAITASLINDTTLSPEERLSLAARLKGPFPEILLAPVVETALKNSNTLEDSRNLWQQAPQAVRNVIIAVRPQFAALMRGIDAWQSHDRNAAAEAFAEVTDASYASQISPYLTQIGSQLQAVEGIYASLGSNSAHMALPTLVLRVQVPAFAQSTATPGNNTQPLTQLSITALNRLGTLTTTTGATDATPYATSHATLRVATFPVTLNLNRNDASVSQVALQRAAAPVPYATTYGALKTLAFTSNSLVVSVNDAAEPVRLSRLLIGADEIIWPNGRYSLTTPLSTNNQASLSMANLLPAGSLLDINANPSSRKANGNYDVNGSLWHPGLSQPQDVSGTFNPQLMTTDLTWKAPLPSGALTVAVGRCQTVPGRIYCGAHYAHASREQFTWQISGNQTAETLATTREALNSKNQQIKNQQANAATLLLNRLESVPLEFVSRTVPNSAENNATSNTTTAPTPSTAPTATPSSATNTSKAPTAITPGNTELLPPPSMLNDKPSTTTPSAAPISQPKVISTSPKASSTPSPNKATNQANTAAKADAEANEDDDTNADAEADDASKSNSPIDAPPANE